MDFTQMSQTDGKLDSYMERQKDSYIDMYKFIQYMQIAMKIDVDIPILLQKQDRPWSKDTLIYIKEDKQ